MASYGKKTRNPGYQPGNHWVICDVCGFAVRSKEALETWDHKVVCREDYETRHPQDFVRAKLDRQAPEGLHRSEPADGNANDINGDADPTYPAADDAHTVPSGTHTGGL